MLIRRKFMHHTTIFFLGASSSENWTELKKDQLVRVGCDTCKIPEKCELTVFGSGSLPLIDTHLTRPDTQRWNFSKKDIIGLVTEPCPAKQEKCLAKTFFLKKIFQILWHFFFHFVTFDVGSLVLIMAKKYRKLPKSNFDFS